MHTMVEWIRRPQNGTNTVNLSLLTR